MLKLLKTEPSNIFTQTLVTENVLIPAASGTLVIYCAVYTNPWFLLGGNKNWSPIESSVL